MTPTAAPIPASTQPELTQSWADHFEPFGAFHSLTLAACVCVIVVWCVVGRKLILANPDSELRFRHRVAWAIIAFQVFATVWRVLPENYTITESIPLHLCRIVGWVVPFMLLTQHRRLRSIVYFWGLGLSTQGYFTPMWDEGFAHVGYWLFWIGHTVIIGAAVQDIWVHRWGPRFRDWGFASLWGLIYAGVVVLINKQLGTNYSYLSEGSYEGTSAVDFLGEWPERGFIQVAGAGVIFLVLYLAALGVRWKKNRPTPTANFTDDA